MNIARASDQTLARASSVLSRIRFVRGEYEGMEAAAENALAADAYLEGAIQLINDLALAKLNLGDDRGALEQCAELRRRRPDSYYSFECELEVLAWGKSVEADPDRAWELARAVDSLSGADPQGDLTPRLMMDVAGVLARADLPDSALAVLRQAVAALQPPRIEWQEAAVRVLLGDHDAAVETLSSVVRQNPITGRSILMRRIFDPLRHRPDFAALLEGGAP